ncbi:plastocyanin/azurin family copper-binding protein [Moheibacter sp.]|uniref:plastocyanin/azurin family copper-binding protein n=1 Tax=Moheibacter sp. TaxID=1965316 RepID=UPI003C755210
MKKLAITFAVIFGVISCGSDTKKVEEEQVKTVPDAQVEEKQAEPNVLELKGTDDMKFDKTEFTVEAGKEVTLTFTNAGVLPIETMGHNVVILEKGADVQAFANASIREKDNDYISDLYITDIIAHTKLLGPGESETIKFTLKEAGEYTFVCTFPGHWIAMKGTITAI